MKSAALIATMSIVTIMIRFIPFLVFRKSTPKYISYLGKVLVEKYGLTDHRDDPDMAEYWDEVTKRYEAAQNA